MRQWLRKLFRRKKAVAQQRPMFPHRFGFNIDYWRQRPDLLEWAQKLYRTPQWHEFISVLRHELPLESTIEAVRAHARMLRIIELMAEPLPPPADEVPATFGAHEEFPDNEQQPQD